MFGRFLNSAQCSRFKLRSVSPLKYKSFCWIWLRLWIHLEIHHVCSYLILFVCFLFYQQAALWLNLFFIFLYLKLRLSLKWNYFIACEVIQDICKTDVQKLCTCVAFYSVFSLFVTHFPSVSFLLCTYFLVTLCGTILCLF